MAEYNPVISIKHFMLRKNIDPALVQEWRDKTIERISNTVVGGIQLTIANVIIFTGPDTTTMLISLSNRENLTMRYNKFVSTIGADAVKVELMSNFEFQKKVMEALKDPSQRLEKDFLL